MCGEGGRSYLGRSPERPGTRTERVGKARDRVGEVSRGQSRPAYRLKARTVERASRAEFSHWPGGRKSSVNWLSARGRRVKPEAPAPEGPKSKRRAPQSKARRRWPDRAWKRLSRGTICGKRW